MSLILAKFLGLYFIGIGIVAFVNPNRFGKMCNAFRVKEGDAAVYLGGLIAMMFGAFIVSVHNFWVMDWPVIITILGWWGLIKGVGLLIYPGFIDLFSFVFNRSDKFYRCLGIVYLLIGLFLLYKGLQ